MKPATPAAAMAAKEIVQLSRASVEQRPLGEYTAIFTRAIAQATAELEAKHAKDKAVLESLLSQEVVARMETDEALAALRSAPVQPAQELREAVSACAKELANQPAGPLFEETARLILRKHLTPHVEAARRDYPKKHYEGSSGISCKERDYTLDELHEYLRLYNELIYQVAMVYPGESRHETARRIIHDNQNQQCGPAQPAHKGKDA